MSILPEFILQQVLVKGLRAFREDGKLIDMLFRNLEQIDLNAVRKFFRDSSIDIALNYPDSELKVPAIVILLKGESESVAFLGDLMQSHEQIVVSGGNPFPQDAIISPATTVGAASASNLAESGPLLLNPTQAIGGTTNTLTLAPGLFRLIDPYEVDALLRLLEGTGAGQVRAIAGIQPTIAQTTITINGTWSTIPDSTTIFDICAQADPLQFTGEPSKIFQQNEIIERLGQHYKASYQLSIVGPNPEITIFLYIIVKAILIINRRYLIRQGFFNVKISGTDFAPRLEYLPDKAYQRAMVVEFDHAFDVYLPLENLAKEIRLDLSVNDPNVTEEGIERVVLSTSFNIS